MRFFLNFLGNETTGVVFAKNTGILLGNVTLSSEPHLRGKEMI